MQYANAGFIHAALQEVLRIAEGYPEVFHNITAAASGRNSVVSVLTNGNPGSGHDETRQGGYVEGVLSVPASSTEVYRLIIGQVYGFAEFEQGIPESL
jgi:hypothetical protein